MSHVTHSAGASALIELQIATSSDPVSALFFRPAHPRAMLVFAHGAGAGMRHGFMASMAERLAARSIASLRFQFPYMERGGQRPDRQPVMVGAVRAAVAAASRSAGKVPLFAGGKSMGGRMTSLAEAAQPLGVRGIIFFGFPLHAAGSRDSHRAEHLSDVHVPMLFLQGTRDDLAPLETLQPIIASLGERATLHIVQDADHSFRVLRRSGRTEEQVFDELADEAAGWIARMSE